MDGKRTTVAFDTNMLLNIARFRADVFAQARELLGNPEFIVPEQVMEELERLAKRGLKIKKEARVAKEAMAKNRVKIVKVDAAGADEALKKLALQAIVATNDKELKDSVKESVVGGKVLLLRQRKFLELG
ncbi:MAG: PIN domain-containing protein [Candidatus Diapherotrites archaeon]|uniref:PIN domain-containing protein n=1 Tax=Candidatus Iainarchaeum sp. TaxID=3101447 RepID=A0A8T3YLZ8_9ARCH|nr:PIN domain-containing protein [Candidatus Diapherotrites archaeon]